MCVRRHRAKLLSDDVSAGEETTEVALVRADEIPWDQLAFPSVRHALVHYLEHPDDEPTALHLRTITEMLPTTTTGTM